MIPFNYTPPFVQAALTDRRLFGQLLNEHGLFGEAVEIGTLRGDFATALLKHWLGRHLTCVDPYLFDRGDKSEFEERYHPAYYGENGTDKAIALERFEAFDGRVSIAQTISSRAVLRFMPESLSFVYIDGNHREPFVSEDIRVWWPKLMEGGILAGHDIHHALVEDFPWAPHVRPAVERFALAHNLTVRIVEQVWPGSAEEFIGSAWSWYIVKPKGNEA